MKLSSKYNIVEGGEGRGGKTNVVESLIVVTAFAWHPFYNGSGQNNMDSAQTNKYSDDICYQI